MSEEKKYVFSLARCYPMDTDRFDYLMDWSRQDLVGHVEFLEAFVKRCAWGDHPDECQEDAELVMKEMGLDDE